MIFLKFVFIELLRDAMNASAIIAAGGIGKRMGEEIPKQLLVLEGKTILERTLEPFVQD